jgi:hypothetical protein
MLRQCRRTSRREQQNTSHHALRPDRRRTDFAREKISGAGEQDHECGDWQYDWVLSAPEKSGEPAGSQNNRA